MPPPPSSSSSYPRQLRRADPRQAQLKVQPLCPRLPQVEVRPLFPRLLPQQHRRLVRLPCHRRRPRLPRRLLPPCGPLLYYVRTTSKTVTKLMRTAEGRAKAAHLAKLALPMRIVMVGTATRVGVVVCASRSSQRRSRNLSQVIARHQCRPIHQLPCQHNLPRQRKVKAQRQQLPIRRLLHLQNCRRALPLRNRPRLLRCWIWQRPFRLNRRHSFPSNSLSLSLPVFLEPRVLATRKKLVTAGAMRGSTISCVAMTVATAARRRASVPFFKLVVKTRLTAVAIPMRLHHDHSWKKV